MPQLDFVWWIVNFFLIWVTMLIVLAIITSNEAPSEVNQTSSLTIKKTTTEWQWL
uniref:ATP synthase F0 subunit 8 n=1 Tax=Astriclypeus mannii TaxID=31188 RepID=UPI001F12DA14|nr:ATP synthase F0 subunit 8 [Astriclypeus mannii]UML37540.1 ATP synthase F0 subunit 8 [Astriclypeus mannii]